jgi:hypothetical protein
MTKMAFSDGGDGGSKETSDICLHIMGDDLPPSRGGQISEASSLTCLRDRSSLRGRDPRMVGVFGVADLACGLGKGWRR